MGEATVRIEPVQTKRDLHQVIMFPFELYRNDPYWVAPLINERKEHYSPEHNPFFEHAEMQVFRAVRDGKTMGTIAAIDDQMHPKIWNESVGFFGIFECVDDPAVASALFGAARAWLAARGRQVMRGPMNLHINDECGLLVDGFDGMPVLMMPYNPRYYPTLIDNYGFTKAKDLYAYKLDIASYGPNLENLPERVSRVAKLARERNGITYRPVDMPHLHDDLQLIKPIHREAWSKNWGAIPPTDGEYDYLVKALGQVLDPDLSYIGFADGKPVGCFVVLPDYCQVAKHLNGRLFPIGWAKYLWYKRKITGFRVLIMGVLEEYRLKGVEALFYEEGCRVAIRKGYEWAEMSWILEDNYKVIRGIESMGGRRYRTYRIYDISTAVT